jgi:hypothetical protein
LRVLWDGPSPHLGERFKLGGRVWYHVKVLHIRHKLFAGTDTLSLSVHESIVMRVFLGVVLPFWGGFELGVVFGTT